MAKKQRQAKIARPTKSVTPRKSKAAYNAVQLAARPTLAPTAGSTIGTTGPVLTPVGGPPTAGGGDGAYIVAGAVLDADGNPLAGSPVKAFDRNIRSEQQLGQ